MTPALTTPELAARLDLDELELELVLLDSQRLGLVRQDEHGRWGLTPDTERRYGRALRALGPARRGESDGGESLWHAPGEDDPALFRGCQGCLTRGGDVFWADGSGDGTPPLIRERNRGETVSNTAGRGARD